jgi:hypothetical protein
MRMREFQIVTNLSGNGVENSHSGFPPLLILYNLAILIRLRKLAKGGDLKMVFKKTRTPRRTHQRPYG